MVACSVSKKNVRVDGSYFDSGAFTHYLAKMNLIADAELLAVPYLLHNSLFVAP